MAKRKTNPRFPERVLSIEQIERQYDGQWVIVEETYWNKNGRALAGRVLAHSRDKETVVETGIQHRKSSPGVRLFLFYAGEKNPRRSCRHIVKIQRQGDRIHWYLHNISRVSGY